MFLFESFLDDLDLKIFKLYYIYIIFLFLSFYLLLEKCYRCCKINVILKYYLKLYLNVTK